MADWDYIKQCVEAVRSKEAEEDRKLHAAPGLLMLTLILKLLLYRSSEEETVFRHKTTGRAWSRVVLTASWSQEAPS